MKYFIDSANPEEIREALSLGIRGITANPSMYRSNNQSFYSFLRDCRSLNPGFLSGEVMEATAEAMLKEAHILLEADSKLVIKIGFSKEGLKLCRLLKQEGALCAMTLIFTLEQAIAAIQAGADYLFPFVGRTEEYGADGLKLAASIQHMITAKQYPVQVVAASVKNLHQLHSLACAGVDYAAISFSLYEKSLFHPLTQSGMEAFRQDWAQVVKK